MKFGKKTTNIHWKLVYDSLRTEIHEIVTMGNNTNRATQGFTTELKQPIKTTFCVLGKEESGLTSNP